MSSKKVFPIFNKPSTSIAAVLEGDLGRCNLEFVADKELQLLQGIPFTVLKLGSVIKQRFYTF